MPSALLLLVVVVALALIVLVAFPLGAATDQKTRSRTAADAAALAGAQSVREAWMAVTAPGVLGFPAVPAPPAAAGGGPAADYAGRHQAALTRYELSGDGTVYARVVNTDNTLDVAARAESDAVAAMAITFSACGWDDARPPLVPRRELLPPPPVPGEPPADGAPPELVPPEFTPAELDELVPDPRPATFVRTLVCGEWRASYVVANSPGFPTIGYAGGDTATSLYEALEPRLIA